MNLATWSQNALLLAFILYCLAFVGFVVAVAGKNWGKNKNDPAAHTAKWGRRSLVIAAVGFAAQLFFFFSRWYTAGHIPTSNMFEFITFLAMLIVGAFLVLYVLYRSPILGAFAMPVAIVLLAYAAVFPKEVQPLIPALKSKWLYIHVTLAAAGEAFFAVGFAAGLMYLLRVIDFASPEKADRNRRRGVEFTLYLVLTIVGFVLVTNLFQAAGYHAEFTHQVEKMDESGNPTYQTENIKYVLPPLIRPAGGEAVEIDSFLGLGEFGVEAPAWMKGINSARKLNTIVWSLFSGLVLYGLFRLIARKPLGAVLQKLMGGIDADDLDEISYRAIAIGYPIFALGGLIFAMIWAHEAWGRFWGWDPKETWALITFLFYTVYLHLRLSRGWQGEKSSWLSVIGFIVVMFTLVGVNLVIAGLHSYAGV